MYVQSEEELLLSLSGWHGCTSRESAGGPVLLTQHSSVGLCCFEIGNTRWGSNLVRRRLHFLSERIAQAIKY